MIEIYVLFRFNTKEKWIEFGQKFFSQKKFEKNYVPYVRNLIKEYGSFDEVYNKCINIPMNCSTVTLFPQFSTKSKKTLKDLNSWIKENHYENNYELHRLRLNIAEILNMNLDEVLNRWDEVTNTKIKCLTPTNAEDVEECDGVFGVVFENDEIQIEVFSKDSEIFIHPMISVYSPNKTYNLTVCGIKWISELKEYLTEYNITINDKEKIIESISTFLNRNNNNS